MTDNTPYAGSDARKKAIEEWKQKRQERRERIRKEREQKGVWVPERRV